MSYGADFAMADPANAPLDPPIFIGADPVIWLALILLLAAAALAGWYLGARGASRRPDAARAIWEAIDEAAKEAMKADDNALKGRAEHLLRVIDKRLGRTLKLAKGLSKNVGRLQKAVDGKVEEDHGPAGGHGGHGHGDHGHGGHAGHGSHGAHDAHAERVLEPAGASASSAAAASAVTVITVGPAAVHPPAETHHVHHAEPHDMTQREQTDALRLAVAAFNQHWREESDRIAELRAAHAELSGGR